MDELSQPKGAYPSVTIPAKDIVWGDAQEKGVVTLRPRSFPSPLAHLLPPESRDCQFLLVEPISTSKRSTYIVMLPATGEMGKRERLTMAQRLARQHGWVSIIVTAPFYAQRAPSFSTTILFEQSGRYHGAIASHYPGDGIHRSLHFAQQ